MGFEDGYSKPFSGEEIAAVRPPIPDPMMTTCFDFRSLEISTNALNCIFFIAFILITVYQELRDRNT